MKPKKDPRRADRDQQLVRQWEKWIRRGWDAKKQFSDTAKEVRCYFKADHGDFYDALKASGWANLDGVAKVTVNLAFQIRGWLAPNIYQRNPTRAVTVRTRDPILVGKAKVIEAYLNYTPNEAGLANESRFAIDSSLLSGRGAAYTGFNDKLGLVTTTHVSINDVVIDPDARRPKEALWIALRRRVPWWQLIEEFGDAAKDVADAELPETLEAGGKEESDGQTGDGDGDEDDVEGTNQTVTIYEVYSKMGLGWRGADVPEEFADLDDQVRFRKIVIVEGHDKPLYVGKWESPLYLDDAWPITFVDLTPTEGELWPVSLMAAAMPNQKAVNLLATIGLEKAKQHAREFIAVHEGLAEDVKEQIVNGGLTEVLPIKANDPSLTLQQLIQRWEPGQISPEVARERDFHLDLFGQITGLLPILKGGSGQEQQVRSATEADIKDRNARSRLQDLNERVEDWATEVARLEGILVWLQLDAKEVEPYVGDLELGWRITPKALGVELPLRVARPGSEPKVDTDHPDPPSVDYLMPTCASYFATEAEAMQAAQAWDRMLPVSQAKWQIATGRLLYVDPEPCGVRPVRVSDVWSDTSYLSARDVVREVSFRVEAGSTKRPDPNKQIDMANTLMANVGQPALQAGDVATYNKVLRSLFKSIGMPTEVQVLLPEPPPQPPMPGPGAPGMPPPGNVESQLQGRVQGGASAAPLGPMLAMPGGPA